ncbi:MAG TPA: DNA-processing protein DprA [Chitinophagaceae bacterium]
MSSELVYQLALTLVPNIGDVQARLLVQHYGSASAVFKAKRRELEKIEGMGEVRARAIRDFKDFSVAENEMAFIEKYKIQPLFLTDAAYPKRLLNCYDPPTILFYKGTADLNAARVLSIVGTRRQTDYGRHFTEQLVEDLAGEGVLVVSGLATGIDGIAHRAALKNQLPTVGVVGHGLDKIYPQEHTRLAREMILEGGGILTEFFSGTDPDKHNFPQRNRIVAGISNATVVIETEVKGGSMITAKLAASYNRDVFALPGRITDKMSGGCNHLIQHNMASLVTGAKDLLEMLGWGEQKKKPRPQKELFIDLSPDEYKILNLLQQKESVHIDEINIQSGLSSSAVAAALLNLELQNVIVGMPGKMYKVV